MGAGPIQLRGAVLARLKAEFLLVAMKAGCMRALDSCHFPDVVTFPPPLVAIGPPLVQVLVVPVADGASSGEALDSVLRRPCFGSSFCPLPGLVSGL